MLFLHVNTVRVRIRGKRGQKECTVCDVTSWCQFGSKALGITAGLAQYR